MPPHNDLDHSPQSEPGPSTASFCQYRSSSPQCEYNVVIPGSHNAPCEEDRNENSTESFVPRTPSSHGSVLGESPRSEYGTTASGHGRNSEGAEKEQQCEPSPSSCVSRTQTHYHSAIVNQIGRGENVNSGTIYGTLNQTVMHVLDMAHILGQNSTQIRRSILTCWDRDKTEFEHVGAEHVKVSMLDSKAFSACWTETGISTCWEDVRICACRTECELEHVARLG
ncbi:hypothetical protein NMY22_g19578 [Coprinellus aureogranulatus]|nr:hypothetical protein NMY22_g19578 [Coprinellus aureogranulatus]